MQICWITRHPVAPHKAADTVSASSVPFSPPTPPTPPPNPPTPPPTPLPVVPTPQPPLGYQPNIVLFLTDGGHIPYRLLTRAPSVGSACCPWAKFPILRSSIPLEPLAVLADQDSVLGSMTAMPQARRLLNAEGATAPNFFIHTPVCCPSRASYISGRMFHRLRINGDGGSAPGEGPPPLVPGANGGGCMQDGCMCINTTLVNTDSFPMYLKVGAGTATSAAGICIVCSIWMGNALFYHD